MKKRSGGQQAGGGQAAAQIHTWESRTELVKQMLAADSAANDAKTARLKALRLEKERQALEEAAAAPAAEPRPARKSVRRINVN